MNPENRIVRKVRDARRKGEKLFCGYITLGYPSVRFTKKIIPAMEKAGVDLVELGIPFSDPQADGRVIQHASEIALRRGVKPSDAFRLLRQLRSGGLKVPVIFFSYYNPIVRFGTGRFVKEMKRSGFDGLIVPDLPPDEDAGFAKILRSQGIAVIYLAAPTTKKERLSLIAKASSGFVYYVSLKGVTGIRREVACDLQAQIRRVRNVTTKCVMVGFGVSNPSQAHETARVSDGVIVGSAIIEVIRKSRGDSEKVMRFIRAMVAATKRSDARRP